MDDSERALLEEIRDLQREHLEEYKRAAARSLSLQEKAMARQEQIGKLYRRVVLATALLVAGAVAFIFYAFGR